MSILKIYVDGSWKPKLPTHAGWAYVIYQDDIEIVRDYGVIESKSRQVDGELFATLKALDTLSKLQFNNSRLELHYDYIGIEAWAMGKWKARSEIAKFYVKELEPFREIVDQLYFVKIKSHAGESAGNDLADQLANEAVDRYFIE